MRNKSTSKGNKGNNRARFYNFARERAKLSDFMCARAGALIEGDTVWIDRAAFEQLELRETKLSGS